MKKTLLLSIVGVLSIGLLNAQAPPPPPAPPAQIGATTTLSGSITQFNYDPDGRIESVLLSRNTLVNLPPEWSMQMMGIAKPGDPVRVAGAVTQSPSGMQIIEPQTLNIAGKNFNLLQPAEPAPYTGSGVIRQLNYGHNGEVNGFMLRDGILARTPPFAVSDLSVLKPGAGVTIAGFARTAPAGKTVVDVQSIAVNGQTISLNMAPARDLGPGGRRGRRPPPGSVAVAPPPPPAGGPPPPPQQ